MNSVVALALLAGSAVASRGSPRCPCVRNVTMPRHKEPFLGNFSDGTPCVLDARTHDGTTSDVCFPVTYGLHRCDTHDLGYDPNCLGTNESAWSEYCAESWCYVDGDKCRDSSYTFWRSSYDYAGGFYWSYDTCGGDSSPWTKDLIVMQGHVSLTGDSFWGVFFAYGVHVCHSLYIPLECVERSCIGQGNRRRMRICVASLRRRSLYFKRTWDSDS